jgi:hypothetical protein
MTSEVSEVSEVSEAYGLHPFHPACVELVALQERVVELEKALGRPFVVERGPWVVQNDGYSIASEDFTHDVILKVSGDFYDDAQRFAYSSELCRRLNAAI